MWYLVCSVRRLAGMTFLMIFSLISFRTEFCDFHYKTLESLLVGNVIPELVNENADLKAGKDTTVLSGSLQELVYKVIIGADLKVDQTTLGNQSAGQSLQVANGAFILAANRAVPSQIDIASTAKNQKILINLHYIKVDFDQPQDYPFSIPSRYEPAQ